MEKFLKALKVLAENLSRENLEVAVELAAEVVAADLSRYKWRGRWPSAADDMGYIRHQMSDVILLEECVLFNLKRLAGYYIARSKRRLVVEPGVWTFGDDPNVARIRHQCGKWAVLVARPTVRGGLWWETFEVSGVQEAYLLTCYHMSQTMSEDL